MKSLKLYKLFIPYRYAFLRKQFGDRQFTVLDVGCGHSSYEIVKRYCPNAVYHAVDRWIQGDPEQYKKMDRFFQLDLDKSTLDEIPNDIYDVIVFSHTIEHLFNGHEVLKRLIDKLKLGGYIYIELPSEKTLYLPAANGTLNFYDDPTHLRLYSLRELGNTCLEKNVRVLKVGKARNLAKTFLITPLGVLYNIYYYLRHKRLSARGLVDVLGYADFLFGVKHNIPTDVRLGSWPETYAKIQRMQPKSTQTQTF